MSADTPVAHHPAESRFVALVDGEEAEAVYERRGDVLVFTHTEVPAAMRGRGIGTRLVRAALDHARAQHLQVEPRCTMFAAYMRGHPETQDLLSPDGRALIGG